MKMLITGGAGFIGSNFVFYMRKAHPEYDLVCIDKLTYAGNLETLASVMDDPQFHFIRADIADRSEMERIFAEEKPDVVLMDIAMPGVDGIEATRLLRSLSPAPHVLILTSLSPSGTVERAVEAGAEGFVSKTDAADDIIRRIIGVCEGAPQFNTASQKQLIDDLSVTRPRSRRDEARALLDALPDREREAVMLAAEGYTNAEIASRMFISERTAKAHLSSAANKLDMGRVQMARLVERADLPARL